MLSGTKLKREKELGLCFVHLVVFMSSYSKLIGCRNRRNVYAEAGGDRAFLMVVL
jgi:hypothetical protein